MGDGGRSGLWIGLLTGLITSVAGGFLYAYLISANTPGVYLIGVVLLVLALGVLAYRFRGKWYLLTKSGIVGYFPKGQPQCQRQIVSELEGSKRAIFIGARGMDLVGESSPFSAALGKSKDAELIEVFLLAPGGKNARLRGQALEVEKKKYQAEGEAVDNFLGSLAFRNNLPIHKYSYTDKPQVRLIQTGRSIWIAFYRSGLRGRELPIVNLSLKSPFAREVEKFIDALRATSQLRSYAETDESKAGDGTKVDLQAPASRQTIARDEG